jgi:hypothetical protein
MVGLFDPSLWETFDANLNSAFEISWELRAQREGSSNRKRCGFGLFFLCSLLNIVYPSNFSALVSILVRI